MAQDPVLAAWKGASALAASVEYSQRAITRRHYEEYGVHALIGLQ